MGLEHNTDGVPPIVVPMGMSNREGVDQVLKVGLGEQWKQGQQQQQGSLPMGQGQGQGAEPRATSACKLCVQSRCFGGQSIF